MKNFFLTLDLEDWFHLEYMKPYVKTPTYEYIPNLTPFNILDNNNIKITIFCLYDVAIAYPELIKSLSEKGHEIALHGFNHELLYNVSLSDFEKGIIEAKNFLEKLTNQKIIGYRAACFSMDEFKLKILRDNGFVYDSSYIQFSQHKLYKQINLNSFKKIDDFIYKDNNFYEFEIPTLKINKINVPISGGGYFRFIPFIIYRIFLLKKIMINKNYIFYIHPFELSPIKINLNNIPLKERIRFSLGRKNNLKNLEKLINLLLKHDFKFITFKQYLEKNQ